MRIRNRQQGLSIIGFLILLAVVGFFAYVAMLLIPAYTEYFGVVKAMKGLAEDPTVANMPIEQIRRKLDFDMNIQYVGDKTVPPNAIKLNTQGGARILQVVYDKQIPFLYNVSLLIHFEHAENLTSPNTGY
jgi:Tfp pilus assembly major pilin PilA